MKEVYRRTTRNRWSSLCCLDLAHQSARRKFELRANWPEEAESTQPKSVMLSAALRIWRDFFGS